MYLVLVTVSSHFDKMAIVAIVSEQASYVHVIVHVAITYYFIHVYIRPSIKKLFVCCRSTYPGTILPPYSKNFIEIPGMIFFFFSYFNSVKNKISFIQI